MPIIGKGGFNGVSGKAYFGDIYSNSMGSQDIHDVGSDQEIYQVYHPNKISLAERGTYSYGAKTGEGQIYAIEVPGQKTFNNPFPHSQTIYAFLADCSDDNGCKPGYHCCKTTTTMNYITRNLKACIADNPAVYLDKMALVLNVPDAELYNLEAIWFNMLNRARAEADKGDAGNSKAADLSACRYYMSLASFISLLLHCNIYD